MAPKPAHIVTAEQNGLQAGFDAWHERSMAVTQNGKGGLEPVRDLLRRVHRAGGWTNKEGAFRNPEGALQYYCNYFGKKYAGFADLPVVKTATKPRVTHKAPATVEAHVDSTEPTQVASTGTDIPALVASLVAQGVDAATIGTIVANVGGSATTTAPAIDEDAEDDYSDLDDETDDTPAATQVQVRRNAPDQPIITFPEPRDPDAPATQGKMWKLNAQGPDNGIFVVVIDSENNVLAGGNGPITAMEAYNLIGEYIA